MRKLYGSLRIKRKKRKRPGLNSLNSFISYAEDYQTKLMEEYITIAEHRHGSRSSQKRSRTRWRPVSSGAVFTTFRPRGSGRGSSGRRWSHGWSKLKTRRTRAMRILSPCRATVAVVFSSIAACFNLVQRSGGTFSEIFTNSPCCFIVYMYI